MGAGVRPHGAVPRLEELLAARKNAKKLMKLTCKVLRKKEKQVTMMCAGKRPTPDELARMIDLADADD